VDLRRIGANLLRASLWATAGFISIVLLWFAANRLFDVRPDPGLGEFLRSEAIPDADNI